jgi:hypothetical protein
VTGVQQPGYDLGMPEQEAGRRQRQSSTSRILVRSLNTSVTGNAQAFGFSVTVTVTFGVVSSVVGSPSLGQMMAFALAAVAAFSLLNVALTVLLKPRSSDRETRQVVLIATATDFLSVAAGVAAAMGISHLLGGWAAWLLAPFCAGVLYVLVQAVELAAGEIAAPADSD